MPLQKRLPQARTNAECRDLIQAIRNPVYRGCIAMMYACGLRLKESIRLRVQDIDSKAMTIRIIGKRNKERLLPLTEPVLRMLRYVWKQRKHPVWLFPNLKDTDHVPHNTISKAFKLARAAALLDESFTPHVLRHSFATQLLEQGIDIRVIQILLGHASLRSTQVYLHLTEPVKAEVRQKLSEFFHDLFNEFDIPGPEGGAS